MKTAFRALAFSLLFAGSAQAQDIFPLPISGEFVFAATWPEDAIVVCFELDGAPLLGTGGSDCVTSPVVVDTNGQVGERTVSAAPGTEVALFNAVISNDGSDRAVVAFARDVQGRESERSNTAVIDFTPPPAPVLVPVE